MKPRIKVLTLAVSDLERSLAFYRDGLGLPTQGVIGQEFEDGAVVFFHLNDDLILALLSGHLARQGRADHGHRDAARGGVDRACGRLEGGGRRSHG